jgi:hypothetical protein
MARKDLDWSDVVADGERAAEANPAIPCDCHTTSATGFPVWTTIDRQPVIDGLRAWDYDLEPVTVRIENHADPASEFHQYWDGWFDVYTDAGRRKPMNAERLWVLHPRTGARA